MPPLCLFYAMALIPGYTERLFSSTLQYVCSKPVDELRLSRPVRMHVFIMRVTSVSVTLMTPSVTLVSSRLRYLVQFPKPVRFLECWLRGRLAA